jgi:NAD(P)-dependent dehydrogenase (short-subunit alcohol dehydrogenase family)
MDHYALVTGGSRNIGAAVARRLTRDGFRVIVADRQEPDHEHLAEFVPVDLTDAAAAATQIARAVEGRAVTRLVNNAGIVEPASLEDTTLDSVDRVMAVNLKPAILCAQLVLPAMKRAKIGRIVNISSRAALGKERRTAYAASKAGLIGMTKTWALELAAFGITVNAIGPGPIRTSLFDGANPPGAPATQAIIERVPVGFLGEPEDIANAVGFFTSDAARFVTGQVLYVCGGMTIGSV